MKPAPTLPQRKLWYGALLAGLVTALIVLVWGATRDQWSSVSGNLGRRQTTFGLVPYLEIVAEPVAINGTRGQGFTRVVTWRPAGLLAETLLTAVSIMVAALCFRWLVHRNPLVGRCDQCGYDLRGTSTGVCPECGTPLRGPGPPPEAARRSSLRSRAR